MAEEKFYTILTNIGKAKVANSIGLGTKINFTKMKVGDGGGSYYNPTEDQTELKNVKWEGQINHVEIDEDNPNWIHVELMIPSNIGGFTIREYGAFDDEDNLIGICKCAETYKPVIANGSTKELLLDLILCVVNTDAVELKIDPTIIFAKKQEIETLRTEIIAQLNDMTNDRIYYCGTTTGTNAYTITNDKIKAYTEGLTVRVKIGTASTGASTLNINGLGAKTILDSLGNAITSGGLKAGIPYNLCYNGSNFIVLGKGGGGNATSDKILSGYKATVDSGQVTGNMPNQGAKTATLNCGGSYTIPKGYHNGSGKVTANSLASQTSATADASKILKGYTAWVNGVEVNGNATIETMGGIKIKTDTVIAPQGTTGTTLSMGFTVDYLVISMKSGSAYLCGGVDIKNTTKTTAYCYYINSDRSASTDAYAKVSGTNVTFFGDVGYSRTITYVAFGH